MINFEEIASAFIVLFAIIDITGSIPIIISLREKGREISAWKATIWSTIILLAFFHGGNFLLELFHVDIASFAIAGAVIIFMMALEMILDIDIFKNHSPSKSATLFPLVFPLIAGAGTFTTLLSLRAEYGAWNIQIALLLNMILVFIVLRSTVYIERLLGKAGIYMLRKFFGIILLAISVRLFTANLTLLIEQFHANATAVTGH